MLTISAELMLKLEKAHLAAIQRQIVDHLQTKFPEQAQRSKPWLNEFARRAIDSARTVWIDQPSQIMRYACALFCLHFSEDQKKMAYFAKIMVSGASAEARLRFAECNLLPPSL